MVPYGYPRLPTLHYCPGEPLVPFTDPPTDLQVISRKGIPRNPYDGRYGETDGFQCATVRARQFYTELEQLLGVLHSDVGPDEEAESHRRTYCGGFSESWAPSGACHGGYHY